VVEGDAQLAGVLRSIAVAVADEVGEVVSTVERVRELAPRHRDVVGAAFDIETAIAAIDERTMIDPDARAALEAQAIAVPDHVGIGEVEALNDDVVYAHAFQVADEAGVRADTLNGFVRAEARVRISEVDRAGNIHNTRHVIGDRGG